MKRSKRERFLLVAERRTRLAIKRIRALGRCGNRQLYEYDAEEAKQIVEALRDELRRVEERLTPKQSEFTFARRA